MLLLWVSIGFSRVPIVPVNISIRPNFQTHDNPCLFGASTLDSIPCERLLDRDRDVEGGGGLQGISIPSASGESVIQDNSFYAVYMMEIRPSDCRIFFIDRYQVQEQTSSIGSEHGLVGLGVAKWFISGLGDFFMAGYLGVGQLSPLHTHSVQLRMMLSGVQYASLVHVSIFYTLPSSNESAIIVVKPLLPLTRSTKPQLHLSLHPPATPAAAQGALVTRSLHPCKHVVHCNDPSSSSVDFNIEPPNPVYLHEDKYPVTVVCKDIDQRLNSSQNADSDNSQTKSSSNLLAVPAQQETSIFPCLRLSKRPSFPERKMLYKDTFFSPIPHRMNHAHRDTVSVLCYALFAAAAPEVQFGKTKLVRRDLTGLQQEFFGGIPFAEPPVGTLHLQCPVLKTDIDADEFDAQNFGLPCLQRRQRNLDTEEMSEDCLTINIFRPKGASSENPLPAVYWMYGGGFSTGGSSSFNGSNIVVQSVTRGTPIVYVNYNYRLGPLGFPQGQVADNRGQLNLGFRDVLTALVIETPVFFACFFAD
ncbi:uncharacterized protein ARMOST_17011 [Armillaria ostoyae]|uniref:Carboxylesterase type B domain-containing protein n=1 Tax=Armillaria ostoyae TaxID=47428 RepID=A0A284RXT7_ARMOS|nr:uncharacterized protein ARMOST_17011 [Armillaria ostoyae]